MLYLPFAAVLASVVATLLFLFAALFRVEAAVVAAFLASPWLMIAVGPPAGRGGLGVPLSLILSTLHQEPRRTLQLIPLAWAVAPRSCQHTTLPCIHCTTCLAERTTSFYNDFTLPAH